MLRSQSASGVTFLPEPRGIVRCGIEAVGGLKHFILAITGRRARTVEQILDFCLGHGFEVARYLDGLIEDPCRIDADDGYRHWLGECILQGLGG